jgi:O-acetyl-ADP-ribose deacetylase (regulator of RNase III)
MINAGELIMPMKTLKPFGPTSPDGIRIAVGDLNPRIASALAAAFAGVHHVAAVEGNLLELTCDAIVSPANSFGDMGGGIDKAIDDFHGGEAQRAVVTAIAQQWLGELPVGAALIVKVPSPRIPFIVASPTMRIPGNVSNTINAYLSMRAALLAVLRYNASGEPPIRTLAIPGLCTGVGGMPYERSSEQMRTAYANVMEGRWREVVHPAMAPYAMG